MALQSANITVMAAAARKAGRLLVRDFGEVEQLQVSRKGPSDFVSVADTKSERAIRQELQKARPDFGFLMEEGGEIKGRDTDHRWIIDPLDGTTNFLHGIPHFSISIALERSGQIIAGVVYQPITDELFWAERGRGAYLDNGQRLRVSGRRDLDQAVIATGIPHAGRGHHARYITELTHIMPAVAGIRRFGSAALDLAYVAAGRCDAFWESGLEAWDIAAGIILVQEAGGSVTEFNNRDRMVETGEILASNTHLHGAMTRLLRDARKAEKA